jgi:hypothetical protein
MDTIKIGPIVYGIELVETLVSETNQKLDGHIIYGQSAIKIDASFERQHSRQVLWHEVIHAILTQAGLDLESEEIICDVIAYGVMGVLTDNKWLREDS